MASCASEMFTTHAHLSAGGRRFPWIDAIMNQLRTWGWMHHLARHSVACFLTRGDLFLHWERGRDVFDKYLIDADHFINVGNWQWLSTTRFFYQYFRCPPPLLTHACRACITARPAMPGCLQGDPPSPALTQVIRLQLFDSVYAVMLFCLWTVPKLDSGGTMRKVGKAELSSPAECTNPAAFLRLFRNSGQQRCGAVLCLPPVILPGESLHPACALHGRPQTFFFLPCTTHSALHVPCRRL